jgi:hypothetical protein
VVAQAALVGAFLPHRPPPDRPRSAARGISFGVICRPQDIPDDEQAVACGAVVDTAIPEMPLRRRSRLDHGAGGEGAAALRAIRDNQRRNAGRYWLSFHTTN